MPLYENSLRITEEKNEEKRERERERKEKKKEERWRLIRWKCFLAKHPRRKNRDIKETSTILTNATKTLLAETDQHIQTEIAVGRLAKVF